FYATTTAAERDGLRPCKRCKPDTAITTPTLAMLLDVCRHIENNPTASYSLSALSKRASISQFQLHRLFRAFLHVTPKGYIEQVRLRALKRQLRSASSVTDAIYDSGFESSSAVYGRLDAHLGMTPRKYRSGGAGVDISFAFGATALGKVLIGATDRGICYLQFGDSERELIEQLASEYPNATVTPSPATASEQFNSWMNALNTNLAGKKSKTELPLDIQGTAFQKRVWEFLRTIPSGEVVSYGEVAEAVGAPKAVRAAASACANNRIGVLIPCHRVIRGNGELGGYRWGLPRKRTLIDMERRARATRKEK
ncbi:MAG TPA: methylated-DNA--[protein]-cysteine S-methyltransferase, partial [Steroidobacteraceae bacterium]|nr:methylated-DNA--[protein]-cysteine S-methyltransferase [Steroidobacteraceae bacterium]